MDAKSVLIGLLLSVVAVVIGNVIYFKITTKEQGN